MSEPMTTRFHIEDFDREYRFLMVRAYPVISGVIDVYSATHQEIDAGFLRVLANANLRQVHEHHLRRSEVGS
jgi:hypothetical protein